MSSCNGSSAENIEENSAESLATRPLDPNSGGGGSSGGPSWSAEFKKRRHAFENVPEGEEGSLFEFADQTTARARKLREMMSQNPALMEPGLDFTRRRSNSSSSRESSTGPMKSPASTRPPPPSSWSSMPHPPSEAPREAPAASSRVPLSGPRFVEDDDDGLGPLGIISSGHASNSQRVLAIGEETGQKERMVPYTRDTTAVTATSPVLQSDDSEREDTGLSRQIEFLTVKNQKLQKQLEEREQERDRLREQLDTQRVEKGSHRAIYSPPGLPSRVLDGRKVLRDSVPLVTSPGIPGSISPGPPCSPLLNSPHRVASPLPLSTTPNPAFSPRPHLSNQTKDYETAPISKRGSSFVMPSKLDPGTMEQYAQQQIDALKRSNFELEKRLCELAEEKRKMEMDLCLQKENFMKMQLREQDLLKDIETLRDENSHHTGAIKRLQSEREGLKSDNESLHDQLSTINDKLGKTEKYYKEVEHENLTLEADIKQLISEKKQLFEEKQKLQITVDNALKTKENYRYTIKELREQNQSLESSILQLDAAKAAKPEKKKVVLPTTKEQKTLGEVMNLREEKLQLEDRLMVAQQEIYSLEAHLKVQDQGEAVAAEDDEIVSRLTQLRLLVGAIQTDLKAVQNDVTFFSGQQQLLVSDSFRRLASKCHEQISVANQDRNRVSETLKLTKQSLEEMEGNFEAIKRANLELEAQKKQVASEVTVLKEEVARLHDQKRLQATQLSQTEALSREKDAKLGKIEQEQKELQNRYSASEKNWKTNFKKLEFEWEGKVAEAVQNCDLLSEEKEQLLLEKTRLETQLAGVISENESLAQAKDEAELLSKQLEEKMVNVLLKTDENERTICQAQEEISHILSQKALLSAQLKLDENEFEKKVACLQKENQEVIAGLLTKKDTLQGSLALLEQERTTLANKLQEIAEKENHISKLESKISILTQSQAELQSEMDCLTEKHAKVIADFQVLEDTEHSRRLDSEKLKMTLTTEIKLLKSKLSTVEQDKEKLEQKLSSLAAPEAVPASAFHAVPSNKQVDQLKKQVAMLQSEQQRKLNVEAAGSRSSSQLVELKNRISMLEAENLHLKDSALKNASSTHSSLDEEAVSSLRKKVTEMSRVMFFLESDKKNLNNKVKSLTSSLKSAREAKDHVTNEHVQKVQEENKSLRERVHKLEGDLTKKLMAADAKIIDTVKENDKLRQILLGIQSTVGSDQAQGAGLDALLAMFRSESKLICDLKNSLSTTSSELDKLESGYQHIEGLQQEIQLSLSADTEQATAESPVSPMGKSIPAVFKSLPAGYISNLQGQREASRPGSRSMSFSSVSSADLQKKMTEITSATSTFGESFKQHKTALKGKDTELGSLQECLATMEAAFKAEAERSKNLKAALSSIHSLDLKGEQLQSVMQRQIEQLQDQVIDRDSALGDIETQMKADFEMHHKKFALMKSQVISLREEVSACNDLLRSKDHYIQKTEEKCLGLEAELFKMQKEMERRAEEQKELIRDGMAEGLQIQGVTSLSEMIRIRGDEMNQLKKLLHDFTRELSQVQAQLESVQREKSVLQSKAIEMERMHIQMKEHMGSDINYLRQLNLQLVEQQMKTEKATEILKEVKTAQSAFKKQRDMIRMESEMDAAKTKIQEQHHKISELEYQLAAQALSLKILHAEKDHSIMLSHHTPELTNKISGIHMRPRSAESARKPNYKFKPRIGTSGLNMNSEFSIVLPSQNPLGNSGIDILNLEEQPEAETAQRTLSLGPMVVTDDEYSIQQDVGKAATAGKHQRFQRVKRGHRRTVSTGSNIVPITKEKEAAGPKTSNTIATSQWHAQGTVTKLKSLPKNFKRPGSADSSRQEVHVRQASEIQPMEQITKTAHALSEYVNNLIDDHSQEKPAKPGVKVVKDPVEGAERRGKDGEDVANEKPTLVKERFMAPRHKLANKSTDSNETTSSEGNGFSSKSSSQSDSSGPRQDSKRSVDFLVSGSSGGAYHRKVDPSVDLSRTESMSSTCSTLSIFGNSTLPSRNHSFTYDGGESSTYESLEIGDSVENLQALGKLGYSPYITPIMPTEIYTTSSSDDESYRKNRRKKSSTTGDNTPRHKDTAYHSNSSCDSDTLLQDGYSREHKKLADIPAHVNESISISDMDRDTTDIEMEQKAADLQHCFGRVRYSSTGSVKICYSESTTSLEDISKP